MSSAIGFGDMVLYFGHYNYRLCMLRVMIIKMLKIDMLRNLHNIYLSQQNVLYKSMFKDDFM